jgi:hypothetical protein
MKARLRTLAVACLLCAVSCGGGSSKGAIHLYQTGTMLAAEDGFQFQALDENEHPVSATWSINEGSVGGTVDSQGYYIAPVTPGVYHVTASREGHQATGTVQVMAVNPQMFINPGGSGSLRLAPGGSQLFRASFNNSPSHAVTWSLSGGGSLAPDGYFTAPDSPGTSTVTATSIKYPWVQQSVQVVVDTLGPPSFVSAMSARYDGGTTVWFDQGITGLSDNRIAWSLTGGGEVNPDGVVTLPSGPGLVQVEMQSVAMPSLSLTAPIEVTTSLDPIKVAVQISPAQVTLAPGASQAFSADLPGLPPYQKPVFWWILEGRGTGGVLTSDGHYTAPMTSGTYHVVVTPLVELRTRAVATIVVSP